MKNIDRLIRLKIYEIILVFLFLAFSFYLWKDLNQSETIQLMKNVNNSLSIAYVDILEENNYKLSPMQDEIAMKVLMPKTISIRNDTHLTTNYAFGIKMNKNSTMDYRNIKILFLGKSYYLKDFYVKEDENFYYFVLEKGNIKESSKTYDIKLWLDENTNSNLVNRTLDYEFANLADVL